MLPSHRPDLHRLPLFGKRALVRILEQVIWGEGLSGSVCAALACSTSDPSLARHLRVQGQEEECHRMLCECYRWFTGHDVRANPRGISASLRDFGRELLHEAQAGHTAAALIGLCVCLEVIGLHRHLLGLLGGVRAPPSKAKSYHLLFGGIMLALSIQAAPQMPPLPALVSRATNEFLFPVGCAFVIYASKAMKKLSGKP